MTSKSQKLLRRLWPVGTIWNVDDARVEREFIEAAADELQRFDDMVVALRVEAIPFRASFLLEFWVALYGLPSKCLDYTTDPTELQQQLIEAIPAGRSHNPQAFIDLAAAFGITITITVPVPSVTGQFQSGMPIGATESRYIWIIETNLIQGPRMETGVAQTGEPIAQWGTERPIECMFNKLQHSHRLFIFHHNG